MEVTVGRPYHRSTERLDPSHVRLPKLRLTLWRALAAGIAATLSFETRASAAVGVAISVTTIPAAAYVGVAIAVGQPGKAGGALSVLGVNVAMLLVGGSAVLAVQRWLNRRAENAAAERKRA
ncbi:MAG TPA: DUF389 domain-containing protein [Micromonosporaceae bacterium]|nr:DUF389 domain-containing protein [Micromonosporaceae bacterium]